MMNAMDNERKELYGVIESIFTRWTSDANLDGLFLSELFELTVECDINEKR